MWELRVNGVSLVRTDDIKWLLQVIEVLLDSNLTAGIVLARVNN